MAKYRIGFVTNSSSSSFVISKKFLTGNQIYKIKHHVEDIDKYEPRCSKHDQWTIEENEAYISGFTHMDNFDMWSYLKDIGVPANVIYWDDF